MVACGPFHFTATLDPKKPLLALHWLGGLVDPRAGVIALSKRKTSFLPGNKPLYLCHITSSLVTVTTELTQLPDMQLTSKRNLKAIDLSFLLGNLHKQAPQQNVIKRRLNKKAPMIVMRFLAWVLTHPTDVGWNRSETADYCHMASLTYVLRG